MSYAKMTAARQRVGYTPATGRILLRRRVRGMLGKAPVLSLSSTGGTMTSTTAHITSTPAKQSWTPFELLMLAPLGALVWYVATQPLVLHTEPSTAAPVAEAPAAPATTLDPDAPVFVVGAQSTLEQRIAPVARVMIEGVEPPAAAQAAEPAVATPPVAATSPVAEAVPQVAAVAQPAPAVPAAPAQQVASSARIAIADGTGVDGLAKDIAVAMEQAGMAVAKTASLSAGSQRRTVIFYRDGFEEEARRLSRVFAQPPALVANTHPGGSADDYDVRLVLGSAAARDKGLLARKGS
ncbi:LytR C-terminal domain-containing protein [Noviherbaspirillum denitrificans]|uniref:LytR/CpsA/Psr regulator C-terminal domain-containing protein n=1 Tax=Noviherbaspirillum denitrificans TaxID=1968433 RepID=A0A254TNG0_9BURK|nr:LytR C-terminal domain-containing protein [Noviherbaspirillum denitrificans]OWW21248.1 hypothetical protein AYR66_19005 [Noviherbaspirillum denitrificans]